MQSGGDKNTKATTKQSDRFPIVFRHLLLLAVGWSVDVYSFEPGVLMFSCMLFFVFGQIRVIEYTGGRVTYRYRVYW